MKIFVVREPSYYNKAIGGIAAHCNSINQLFENSIEIELLPIKEYLGFNFLGVHAINIFQLIKDIKGSNCDLVHVHGSTSFDSTFGIIAAYVCKKKIVYTAHLHPFETRKHSFLSKIFFYAMIYPFLFFVNEIVTLNNEDTEFFKQFSRKVTCIPHWSSKIPKINNEISKIDNLILFVGGANTHNKGFHHLCHLPVKKYEIHCVGQGEVRDKNIIQHVNLSSDKLEELYQKASLLVVPSMYEAFSLVSLEALCFGTPVVMSDKVRIADHLNGCKGYRVFKYDDFDDFQKAVQETIGSEVDTEEIMSIFSIEKAKQKYISLYLNS